MLAGLVLVALSLLPFGEVVARKIFRSGIFASAEYVQHLVLWITFLGALITSRERRHLSLSVGIDAIHQPYKGWIETATSLISVTVTCTLAWSAASMVLLAFDPADKVGVIPVRLASCIMPIGFAFMAVRAILWAPPRWAPRLVAGGGLVLGTFIGISAVGGVLGAFSVDPPAWIETATDAVCRGSEVAGVAVIIVLLLSALLGTPIFVVLGALAVVLFLKSGGQLAVIPNEAYSTLTGVSLPAIPLFTFAGFILSESKAGERLVKLFQSFFGWLPGGEAIMAVLVCTFFTTFTGASGVTILALGALLSYVLIQNRYEPRFARGLLTASGSIGLLFPPSLPIILYGVIAHTNIKKMFVGGILPGVLFVLTLALFGAGTALRHRLPRKPFHARAAVASLRESAWEILLPAIILLGFFMGITTLTETGAVAVVYVLLVEVLVHRDIRLRQLPAVFARSIPVIGGVLIILAAAKGFSYYIVDVEVPVRLTHWAAEHIHSKYVFLLLLNVGLLITGCLMDIFSGIIFLANLELGYLTPPVGLNLFLASYRFERPLPEIYRDVLPFFFALLVTVLLITYVPWLSTGLLDVIKF